MRPTRKNFRQWSKSNQSSETVFQPSLLRYLRFFARARAMRFWRPEMLSKAIGATAFTTALTICVSTSYAQSPASLELSSLDGVNGFVINGIYEDDRSGASVSGAGDVNGDGFDDVIIGASSAENIFAGESYVVFGGNEGFSQSLDLTSLDGTNGFVINGIDSNDSSGFSVGGAGDVNGDGFDDLIIGALGASRNGNVAAGESYVVFGSGVFSPSLDLSDLNGTNGFQINGIDGGDLSGTSVSGAGDVNNDGFDDLIIGARSAAPNGNTGAGETYVIFGSNDIFSEPLSLSTLNGANGFVINGIESGDNSGVSVSGAGDVNGDGFDDVIIGAQNADPNGDRRFGQSHVVFGSESGFSAFLDLSELNGTNGFVINGVDARDSSGFSVSGAGDFNGDGIDDLIIGAIDANANGYPGSGESYIVFGSTDNFSPSLDLSSLDGTNGFVINGVGFGGFQGRSGWSVSTAGDVNGDGLDDVVIGAPYVNEGAGESYVVFGSNDPFSSTLNLSDLDGIAGFHINGIDDDYLSGFSVDGAGDFNGDGIDDLIIGAPRNPLNSGSLGESYVVFGQAVEVLKGDVNRDSNIDFLDIAPFISVLSASGFQAEADIDCNGAVDFLDISPFITLLSGN